MSFWKITLLQIGPISCQNIIVYSVFIPSAISCHLQCNKLGIQLEIYFFAPFTHFVL